MNAPGNQKNPKSGRYGKNLAAGITSIILLAFILSLVIPVEHKDDGTVWADVKRGEFEEDLMEAGEVRAFQSTVVKTPRIPGVSMQIVGLEEEGTILKKGDFLVQFDTTSLRTGFEAAVDAHEAELAERERIIAQQESNMSGLHSTAEISRLNLEGEKLRKEQMKYESALRQEEADLSFNQAQINYNKALNKIKTQKVINESELEKIDLRLKQAELKVQEIRHQIRQMTLSAPIHGMVVYEEIGSFDTREKIKVGDTPRPGSWIVGIPDLSRMEVTIRLGEVDIEWFRPGQDAQIRLEAFPDRLYTGNVRSMAPLAESKEWESNVRIFQAVISIDQADSTLKPGMTAAVRITTGKYEDALYVPTGTVFEINGEPHVLTSESQGKSVPVSLGPRNDFFVMIMEGLEEGDKVAWNAPISDAERLGSFAAWDIIERDHELLQTDFAALAAAGLSYDYDGNRGEASAQEPADEPGAGLIPGIEVGEGGNIIVMGRDGQSRTLSKEQMETIMKGIRGGQDGRSFSMPGERFMRMRGAGTGEKGSRIGESSMRSERSADGGEGIGTDEERKANFRRMRGGRSGDRPKGMTLDRSRKETGQRIWEGASEGSGTTERDTTVKDSTSGKDVNNKDR